MGISIDRFEWATFLRKALRGASADYAGASIDLAKIPAFLFISLPIPAFNLVAQTSFAHALWQHKTPFLSQAFAGFDIFAVGGRDVTSVVFQIRIDTDFAGKHAGNTNGCDHPAVKRMLRTSQA
ncbi:hypothetical protein PMO01_00735 [Pseudomonas moraviensis R28-S]|uniref:Uncharacterized protein n=1 Tax=Pseudomonas moraviensis R28-S TaxID=1395516 RepID=V8REN5_9PSED|nr:hypothetical protein PMO01_00735 [Pseudomonas moraviensis R28-S]